ncbi:Fumarylacetoacetase [Fusarium sp. LHS14.1]|nr:Fumarylacetoacetase [Fusarium sp. LHS14.1]
MDFSHHFSDENIPFGIASSDKHHDPQAVTRLGNTVLFLADLQDNGLFGDLPKNVFKQSTLNEFAALPRSKSVEVRKKIQDVFRQGGIEGFLSTAQEDVSLVTMHLPVEIKDFSDFSCSLEHVTNAGRIVVGSTKPPPSFFKFPIGYQGRTSSIVVSGTDIERPRGQFRDKSVTDPLSEKAVIYGSSKQVDYEVELAAIVGKPLPMKQKLKAKDAEEHIFGFVILNDWSARDIQGFEMNPLGPFNGKSLGTSISPWIVTLEALERFKTGASPQQESLVSYLRSSKPSTYSITMEVEILNDSTATKTGVCPVSSLYWSPPQLLAHAVSSGSALRTGDILATGTVSGSTDRSRGCLLETTEGGTKPLTLSDGSRRTYLEDGDVVRITAVAGEASSGVGFGECIGRLTPSRTI